MKLDHIAILKRVCAIAFCTVSSRRRLTVPSSENHRRRGACLKAGIVLLVATLLLMPNARHWGKDKFQNATQEAKPHRGYPETKRPRPTAFAEAMPAPLTQPKIRPSNDQFDQLPQDEQASLSSAIHNARHAMWPIADDLVNLPANRDASHFAANPGQGLTARFLKNGAVRFESGLRGNSWQATLRLKSTSAGGPWSGTGNKIECRHQGITEWYENRDDGFEHGFTIHERPHHIAEGGPLTLQLVLGELRAEVDPGSPADLIFTNPSTKRGVLGYRNLLVWDAEGRQLAASMRPSSEGVLIALNDQEAIYPITVDPLLVSLEAELGEPPDRNGDLFGLTLDIDGPTAVVGTATADDVGQNGGAAYIFVRNGNVWTLQQKLFKTGLNDRQFGCSVALSGDTVAIGATRPDAEQETIYNTINIYNRSGTTWTFSQRIAPFVNTLSSEGAYYDPLDFRRSPFKLDIQGDRLLTGSSATGIVEFYSRNGGSWSSQAVFMAPSGFPSIYYGYDIALSGNAVAVSAPDIYNGADGTATGRIFVYRNVGNLWTDPEIISASGGVNGDQFGCAFAFSGNHLVVGAKARNFSSVSQDIGAIYPFEWNGSSWTSSPVILSSSPTVSGEFGAAIAISGSTMAVGAPRETGAVANSGTASIYQWNGTSWVYQRKLQAVDGTANNYYGYTIAMSGDSLIIGAPNHLQNSSGLGAAYLHVLGDGSWPLQQKLVGELSGYAATANFYGTGAALDGDTAVLGSDYIDTPYGTNSGAIYIFQRTAGVWSASTTLVAADAAANGAMGKSVAISGTTVLAGSPNHGSGTGAVYVFVRSGQNWSQQAMITAPSYGSGSGFGNCLAIDGETFVTSVPNYNFASGKALVYNRTGSTWGSPIVLTSQQFNGSGGVVVDEAILTPFGLGVAIKGNKIAIGSPFNAGSASASGKVRIYTRNVGNGMWDLNAVLSPTDQAVASDWFGWALAFSTSDRLAVGAPGGVAGAINGAPIGDRKGKAFIFNYTGAAWGREAVFSGTGIEGENFGISLDMTAEDRFVVGAWEDSPGASGKARLYQRAGGTWTLQQTFSGPNPLSSDRFGATVSIDGDTLLVAAPYRTARSWTNGGTAYIYRIADPVAVPVLTISRSGGNVILSWPPAAGWSLYQSPSLMSGSWVPAGVTTPGNFPYPIASAPKMFFRLQNP